MVEDLQEGRAEEDAGDDGDLLGELGTCMREGLLRWSWRMPLVMLVVLRVVPKNRNISDEATPNNTPPAIAYISSSLFML